MPNDETIPPAIPRRRRWGRVLLWSLGAVVLLPALLVLGLYLTADSWRPLAREHVQKWLAEKQVELGPNLPAVDEVEILALGGEAEPGERDSFSSDIGPPASTLARRTVQGVEAGRIAELWRGQHFGKDPALCFSPHYALRFRHQGRLILETAVCWQCDGHTMPMGPFPPPILGFDATSPEAQSLLALLTELLPHPPEK